MAIGNSLSRSSIRLGVFGMALAILALVTWIPAQAQTGESRHAKRAQATARTSTSSPAVAGVGKESSAPAAASIRRVEVPARPFVEAARRSLTAAALPLPTNGKTIPTHVVAPYYHPSSASAFANEATWAASGVRYITIDTLTPVTSGDPCTVYWEGGTSTPVSTTGSWATGIANVRTLGGDIIPSFSGNVYSGSLGFIPELADRCTDVSKIAAELERVITTLNVTRIDFDTEEDSDANPAGITRRNQAIAMVQAWAASAGRTVEWAYTLPVEPDGLSAVVDGSGYIEGAGILRNAVTNGARIDKVDIMTFDFYDNQSFACQAGQAPPHEMGQDTIAAASHLYDTLRVLYPTKTSAQLWDMIGFCAMPGSDDFSTGPPKTNCENTYRTDATTDIAWAVSNGLGLVTFWDYQRDTANLDGTGGPIWGFSHIYDNYSGTGPTLTGWGASTALASSDDPSAVGEGVTFTAATTALDPGLPTPTGTVQFAVDGINSGAPVALDGNGDATSAPISNLSTGNHAVTATYSGDAVFTTETSAPLTQSIGVPIPVLAVPNIALTSSENPAVFGDQPTYTATVTGTAGTPMGTVQFVLDDVDLNGPVTLANGQANSGPFSDSDDVHWWPTSGPHVVTVIYSGDANYQSVVSSPFTQTVTNCGGCATDVTVASSPNPSYAGQAVTFTWSVSPTQIGYPTGSVQIVADGTTVLGTWPSLWFNEGTVQVQSSALSTGSHSITAVYSGDADFASSTSAPLTQSVVPSVTVTVQTSPTGRSFSVDGGRNRTTTTNYTWAQGGQHTLATTSPQAGSSGTQYVWTSWSDGGAISHTVTAPTQTTTYTAYFNTQYQLTTAVSPSGAGTVTPATGGYDNANTPVPLTANPAAGYAFKNWTTTSGGTLTNANSATAATISLSGPATVTANFTELPTSLSGLITAKSGTQSARTWTITLSNTGPGAANAAQISGLTLTQTFGAVCTPVIGTAFPLAVGNIGPGSSGSGAVAINFTGCPNNARFTVSFPFSANAGTVTGSRTLYNQFQ